jgi:protein SCO1
MMRAGTLATVVSAMAAAALASPMASAQPPHSSHSYSLPDPATMGGAYTLRDVAGRAVTSASLRGRWNIVYFGYSRCTDTCPLALPTIVEAARTLNARGTAARAVFVDIEAPSGVIRPRNAGVPATQHGHHGSADNGTAINAIAQRFGASLLVLTGSRSQLNAATVAFQVRREHTPARPLEKGHSINHTSFIYLVSPAGVVTKYLYHDVAPQEIVRAVRGRETGS